MANTVLFADDTVRVTESHVTLGNQLFATGDISAAKATLRLPPGISARGYPTLLISASVAIMCIIVILLIKLFIGDQAALLIMSLYFFQAISIGVALVLALQLKYAIELVGTFGRAYIFISKDRDYNRRITRAIQTAIGTKR